MPSSSLSKSTLLAYSLTPKMEALRYSETSVNTYTASQPTVTALRTSYLTQSTCFLPISMRSTGGNRLTCMEEVTSSNRNRDWDSRVFLRISRHML
jgi:hypothetical protein